HHRGRRRPRVAPRRHRQRHPGHRRRLARRHLTDLPLGLATLGGRPGGGRSGRLGAGGGRPGRWAALVAVGALALALVGCSKPDPPPAPPADTIAKGVVITPTGVVAPILSSFEGGYWVRTPCFGVGLVLGDDDEVTRIE